jgi:hypothetical protein
MSEIMIGTRVRAVTQISSGYGEGRRVVEPGQEGTVRAFSRTKRYPQVEWDAGWTSLCRPDDVEGVADRRVFAPGDVAGALRESAFTSLAVAGIAAEVEEVDGGGFSVHLRNGQHFVVTVREAPNGGAPRPEPAPSAGGESKAGMVDKLRGLFRGEG